MASFDIFLNNSHKIIFKDSYSFFKKELISAKYIKDDWEEGVNNIDKQLKKDLLRTNCIINGNDFTQSYYEFICPDESKRENLKYQNLMNLIEKSNFNKDMLMFAKSIMLQSLEFNFIHIISKFIKGLVPTRSIPILFNIQFVNSNIINKISIIYVIKDPNFNDENPIIQIHLEAYINYNENKFILKINDIKLYNNKNPDYNIYITCKGLLDLKEKIDKKLIINKTFYTIINLTLSDILKSNNINFNDSWTYKNNNIIVNKKNLNNYNNNIILSLFSSDEVEISSKYISIELFKHYNCQYNNKKNVNHISNTNLCPFILKFINNKTEKNLFNKSLFITEYYFDIIYIDSENNKTIVGQIYTYNVADLNNNSYIIYYHIRTINIRNIIKLKIENKKNGNLNKTLNNIIQKYNDNIEIKLDKILQKIKMKNLFPNKTKISENKTKILENNNKLNIFLENISKTLPLQKNNNFKESDLLLISFNEDNKSYNEYDCLPMIIKILKEKPKIIVLCTQNSNNLNILSSTYQTKFQMIENLNYTLILGNNESLEVDSYGENSDQEKSYEKKSGDEKSNEEESGDEKSNIKSFFKKIGNTFRSTGKKIIKTVVNRGKKIKKKFIPIINKNITKVYFSNDYLQSIHNNYDNKLTITNKLFDQATITLIDFEYLETKINIAIVNCNLLDIVNKGYNIVFMEMLNYTSLLELSKKYNIFLCGDINFKFISKINNIKSNIFKEKYLNNNSKNQFTVLFGEGEMKTSDFYQKILYSIKQLGRHLTSHYIIGQYKKEIELYKKLKNEEIKNDRISGGHGRENSEEIAEVSGGIAKISDRNSLNNKIFNINNNNIGVAALKMDRILYVLKDNTSIKVNNKNFNVHFFPDKSTHKMISLTCDLDVNNIVTIENKGKMYIPKNVAGNGTGNGNRTGNRTGNGNK